MGWSSRNRHGRNPPGAVLGSRTTTRTDKRHVRGLGRLTAVTAPDTPSTTRPTSYTHSNTRHPHHRVAREVSAFRRGEESSHGQSSSHTRRNSSHAARTLARITSRSHRIDSSVSLHTNARGSSTPSSRTIASTFDDNTMRNIIRYHGGKARNSRTGPTNSTHDKTRTHMRSATSSTFSGVSNAHNSTCPRPLRIPDRSARTVLVVSLIPLLVGHVARQRAPSHKNTYLQWRYDYTQRVERNATHHGSC